MQKFDEAHRAVHYPPDRSLYLWLSKPAIAVVCVVVLIPVVLAWLEYLFSGLPAVTAKYAVDPSRLPTPHGFPGWIRIAHLINFFFLMLAARSGLSILYDHPRLYRHNDCTPGAEWMRFTPVDVPKNRLWTAKDDARYISPLVGLPGYRHTIGSARSWHFLSHLIFLLNGFAFVILLFCTAQWRRLVPTSWDILLQAWNTFVHYATMHWPPEPDGFYFFNPLQQLAYFGVVFVIAPLSLFTGMAMSPAIDNHFPWFPKIFGGRQAARSLHFLSMIGYVAFIIVHVSLVVLTGFRQNMNHIVMGTDDREAIGLIIGLGAIVGVVLSWVVAHAIAWKFPRGIQKLHATLSIPFINILNRFHPKESFVRSNISPFFWPNGKLPTSDEWKNLAANGFRDYRLNVGGLVEHPLELSLEDLRKLGDSDHIALHHCIQGWSGVAQWGGIPMSKIAKLAKPKAEATTVAFFSFGEGLYGGIYYDTQTMENALKPQCMLAYEMNGKPLSDVYGAPLRLRAENQLGYKMVKWIRFIEFVPSEKVLGEGFGGRNEDDEFFDLIPNI